MHEEKQLFYQFGDMLLSERLRPLVRPQEKSRLDQTRPENSPGRLSYPIGNWSLHLIMGLIDILYQNISNRRMWSFAFTLWSWSRLNKLEEEE